MKQYIIRKIGWAYDDSNYYTDGEQEVVEIFDDYKSAIEFKNKLDRTYLLYNFESLYRYLFSDDFIVEGKRLPSVQNLHKYLVRELNFNPTILLHPGRWGEYEILMFLTSPTNEQLDQILTLSGLSFFKIIEVEKENSLRFYKAKTNSKYLRNNGYYLYSKVTEKDRIFNTYQEAMEVFKNRKRLIDFRERDQDSAYICGTYRALSSVPQILSDFIQYNAHLSYGNEKLRIPYVIDTQTLFQLNALLTEPFLVYEEIELDDSFLYDFDTHEKCYNRVFESSIEDIGIRLKRAISLNELQNSPEYLSLFYMKFERFVGYGDSYLELIQKYYSTLNHEDVPQYGLIKTLKLENDTYEVTATFSPIKSVSHPSFNNEGIGFGQDIHTAFFNSMKDWLDKHYNVAEYPNKSN